MGMKDAKRCEETVTVMMMTTTATANKQKWINGKLFEILVEYNFIKYDGDREHEWLQI